VVLVNLDPTQKNSTLLSPSLKKNNKNSTLSLDSVCMKIENRRHALTRALSISFITFKDLSIDSVTSFFFFSTNLSRERNRNIKHK
jgi:hypothetical protein